MQLSHLAAQAQAGVEAALTGAFRATDALILLRARREGWNNGCTAVVAFLQHDTLYLANCGDSEAVLAELAEVADETHGTPSRETSLRAVLLSAKHVPSEAGERERIERSGGRVVMGRVGAQLAVARAFGDADFKLPLCRGSADWVSAEPHLRTVPLQAARHRFLVLACDGLWDRLSYQQAVDAVAAVRARGGPPAEAAASLVQQALAAGTLDNVTAVVVYLHAEPSESVGAAGGAGGQ